MVKKDSGVRSARRRAAKHMSVGMIGATMKLDGGGYEELYLLVTGDRYLLTDHDYPEQVVLNGFEDRKELIPKFFAVVFTSITIYLLVRSA